MNAPFSPWVIPTWIPSTMESPWPYTVSSTKHVVELYDVIPSTVQKTPLPEVPNEREGY